MTDVSTYLFGNRVVDKKNIYFFSSNHNHLFFHFRSLFIDRLEEEAIKRVSENLESRERDLFGTCVNQVKAYLSKEPFQEFLE